MPGGEIPTLPSGYPTGGVTPNGGHYPETIEVPTGHDSGGSGGGIFWGKDGDFWDGIFGNFIEGAIPIAGGIIQMVKGSDGKYYAVEQPQKKDNSTAIILGAGVFFLVLVIIVLIILKKK